MLVVYVALLCLLFYKSKYAGKAFFEEESLSRNVTDSVKGFFVWMVFLSHFASYVSYVNTIDILGLRISRFFGQLVVALFLFYSGYGVFEGIKAHGQSYIRKIPKNRFLKTLVHFDLAVLFYLFLKVFLRQPFSKVIVLLSVIGWESLGNSNWYMFVIMALYLLTYISFCISKDSTRNALLILTLFSCVFIVFLYVTRDSWWYDTLLCYVLGMWFSRYKEKIMAVVTKNNYIWGICTLMILSVFLCVYYSPVLMLPKIIRELFLAPVFCLLVTFLLMKFYISNDVLKASGKYVFELYILQRIPMILFKEYGVSDVNIYLYFILCVFATIILAGVFRKFVIKLDDNLFAG